MPKVKIKSIPKANSGIQMLGNGNVQPIGDNAYTGDTMLFKGPSHDNGGIPIAFSGKKVEVEGEETGFVDRTGSLNILGNMNIPGTNTKFKNAGKEIAKAEMGASTQMDKAMGLINTKSPYNQYSALSFNSGIAMMDGAEMKQKKLAHQKEWLASLQNKMLDKADELGIDPKDLNKKMSMAKWGKKIDMAKGGKKITPVDGSDASASDTDAYRQAIINAAKENGVDPEVLQNLVEQESSYNPSAVSPKGAKGLMQLMPSVAKRYGLTEKQLLSSDPNDVQAVANAGAQEFKQLVDKNNGDYKLALAAYNGGQGAIEFVKKKLGKDNITGDEWLSFMNTRRKSSPSEDQNAWQNQTYDYVNSIYGNSQDRGSFNEKYYDTKSSTPPGREEPSTIDKLQISQPLFPVGRNMELSPIKQENMPQPILPQGHSRKIPSLADNNKLGITDFLGELSGLADRPDFVPHQRFDPKLFTPYQVSFQDRLNQNNSTFKDVAHEIRSNAGALAQLAAQKYGADQSTFADQFRTNQGITNDITNKNISILNDAQLKNLQLSDTQMVRQAQAKAISKGYHQQALASIEDKVAKNRLENFDIRMQESMSNYRFNPKTGQMEYMGPKAEWFSNRTSGTSNQQMAPKKIRKTYDAHGTLTGYTEEDDAKEKTGKWGKKITKSSTAKLKNMI